MPDIAARARSLVAGNAKPDPASQSSYFKSHCFGQAFRRYTAVIIDDQRRFCWRGGCDQFRASWDIPHNMQPIIGEPQFTFARSERAPRSERRSAAPRGPLPHAIAPGWDAASQGTDCRAHDRPGLPRQDARPGVRDRRRADPRRIQSRAVAEVQVVRLRSHKPHN